MTVVSLDKRPIINQPNSEVIADIERLLQMELAYFGGSHASEFVSNILYAARGTAAAALTITFTVSAISQNTANYNPPTGSSWNDQMVLNSLIYPV